MTYNYIRVHLRWLSSLLDKIWDAFNYAEKVRKSN